MEGVADKSEARSRHITEGKGEDDKNLQAQAVSA